MYRNIALLLPIIFMVGCSETITEREVDRVTLNAESLVGGDVVLAEVSTQKLEQIIIDEPRKYLLDLSVDKYNLQIGVMPDADCILFNGINYEGDNYRPEILLDCEYSRNYDINQLFGTSNLELEMDGLINTSVEVFPIEEFDGLFSYISGNTTETYEPEDLPEYRHHGTMMFEVNDANMETLVEITKRYLLNDFRKVIPLVDNPSVSTTRVGSVELDNNNEPVKEIFGVSAEFATIVKLDVPTVLYGLARDLPMNLGGYPSPKKMVSPNMRDADQYYFKLLVGFKELKNGKLLVEIHVNVGGMTGTSQNMTQLMRQLNASEPYYAPKD